MLFKVLLSMSAIATLSLSLNGAVFAQIPTETLVRRAVSETPSESKDAIASLRAQGSTGLQAFLKTYSNQLSATANPQLRAALDQLCQQRDCYASQLYWYTDIEQAKAAAKASGKPILSLRLLGRLDEDLSCANSRFFRVALYPNTQVSKVLRDRFILHWQSVRPAPKVTIDFGDGRKLERTLTGNSIHYILDAQGRPVEALPGLYGPQAFLQQLEQAEKAVKESSKLSGSQRDNYVRQYYRDRIAAIRLHRWSMSPELESKDNVVFLGYVPDEHMFELYRRARALIMPSFFGPTNIPQLEAFVAGCPVGASKVYGVPDQVGDAALLFDPKSSDEIAEAMERLWTDDALCNCLIEKGKERASEWGPIQFSQRLKEIVDALT